MTTPTQAITAAQLRQNTRDYLASGQAPRHSNPTDLARWLINQRPEHAAQLLAQLFAALTDQPTGCEPPGSVPPGSVPPGSVPPGSVPPAATPSHQATL